jgi:chorismate dehydratase
MNKIKITAVSYLNTIPFVYGMRQALDTEKFGLSLDIPSLCAKKMIEGKADIGLVPVGALSMLRDPYQMLDYCIAADGEVSSVLLISKVPLPEITEVHLDTDSRTSVLLVRVLASHYWKIDPAWINYTAKEENELPESIVVIGDKAFGYRSKYPYCYDLSAEWKKFTGLPFVFAVWVARQNIEDVFIKEFRSSLEFGITHIHETIRENHEQIPEGIDINDYLTRFIHFRLEEKFKQGMGKFLEYIKKSTVIP